MIDATMYNNFLREWADYDITEDDPHGHGKRVPYIGWFWRDVDFAERRIPLGHCGDFIGFMRSNKWNHPERVATPGEFAKIIEIIDGAIAESKKRGSREDVRENVNVELTKLWAYMQTLDVSHD
jgi:hypothetical protein